MFGPIDSSISTSPQLLLLYHVLWITVKHLQKHRTLEHMIHTNTCPLTSDPIIIFESTAGGLEVPNITLSLYYHALLALVWLLMRLLPATGYSCHFARLLYAQQLWLETYGTLWLETYGTFAGSWGFVGLLKFILSLPEEKSKVSKSFKVFENVSNMSPHPAKRSLYSIMPEQRGHLALL